MVLKCSFLIGINCLCDLELFRMSVKNNKHKIGKMVREGQENDGQESKEGLSRLSVLCMQINCFNASVRLLA